MKFIWNKEKSEVNQKKHTVSFKLAARVFLDPNRVEIFDKDYSIEEDRFITIGIVENVPILVVYTIVENDAYRIISARKALAHEVDKFYQQ